MLDAGLYLSYILLGIAVVAAIVLPLLNAVKQPAVLIKSLIGVGSIVVLFGLTYAFSDGSVDTQAAALGVTEGSSKLIGSGLTSLAILSVIAFVGVAYSEIKSLIS